MDSTGQLVLSCAAAAAAAAAANRLLLLRKDVKNVYNSLLDLSSVYTVIKGQHVYFTLVKCQL